MTKQSSDSASSPPSGEATDDRSVLRRALAESDRIEPDDLTRYKTDELQQRFQQLFGVSHFLPWAAAGLGGSVVVLMVVWLTLIWPTADPVVATLTFVYMGLQGLLVGVLAAGLLIVARIFQQLTAIVDITVETLREALADLKKLGDPTVRAELTGALVQGAVVPSLKSVITVKMGLLRAPVGAVLNWLLGKTADKLTSTIRAKLDDDADPDDDTEHDDTDPDDPGRDLDDADSTDLAARGDSHLVRMHDRIEIVARRTRRATLIPAAVIFAVVAGISSVPWLIALLVLI